MEPEPAETEVPAETAAEETTDAAETSENVVNFDTADSISEKIENDDTAETVEPVAAAAGEGEDSGPEEWNEEIAENEPEGFLKRKFKWLNFKRAILLTDYVLIAAIALLLIVPKAPGAVTNVKVLETSYDSVSISWPDCKGADGYHVYRSEDGKDFEYVDTTQSAVYEDVGLQTGKKYTYAVAPYNGLKRQPVEASPTAEATPELGVPKIKGSVRNGLVSIKIQEVEGATGYEIYRNGKKVCDQEDLEYVDKQANSDKEYKYQVKAYRYKEDPVFSDISNKVELELKTVSRMTADILGSDLVFKWEGSDYYTSFELSIAGEEPVQTTDTEYFVKDFDPDRLYEATLVGLTEDKKIRSPENVQTFKIEEEGMTNQEAIDAACDWAVDIANDNSFTYGTGSRAHRYGCYFCGTNVGPVMNKKGSSLVNGHSYEKTYCCNPFVHAAFAHGAGDPAMLRACQRGDGIAMSEKSFTEYGHWKNVGKPAKGDLQRGDVLVRPDHVALYIGNGQDVRAVDKGWTDKSISVFNLPQSTYNKFKFVMRYTGNGRGTIYKVHEVGADGEEIDGSESSESNSSDNSDN